MNIKIAAVLAATAFLGACSVDGHVNRCGIGAGANIGPGTETCIASHPVAQRYLAPPPVAYGQPGPAYGASYATPYGGSGGYYPPHPAPQVPDHYVGEPIAPKVVRVEHPPGTPNQYRCDAETGRRVGPGEEGNAWCD